MREFIKAVWNSAEFWIGWLTLLFLWTVLDLIGAVAVGDVSGIIISAVVLVAAGLLIWVQVHLYNQSVTRGKILKADLGIVGEVKVTIK